MSSFFKKLKNKHVIKSGLAYLVAAWLIIQVLAILLPTFNAPSWIMQATFIALAVGFPIWLVISWIYDFTPNGLVRTADHTQEEESSKRTNSKLNRFIIGALALIVILLVFNQVRMTKQPSGRVDKLIKIAILPFENLSPNEKDKYIVQGFAQDMYTQLTKLSSFKVLHPMSTAHYKGENKDFRSMAKELEVSHILYGNVRIGSNDILVSAQLVDADEANLWAESFFESNREDLLMVQQRVARQSSEAILGRLTPEERISIDSSQKIDSAARFDLNQARTLFRQSSTTAMEGLGFLDAIPFYEKALKIQPDLEEALSSLSYILAWNSDTRERADSLANEALKHNPIADMANTAKAIILNIRDQDTRKAIELLERTVQFNPSAAFSHDYLARLRSGYKEFTDLDKSVYHSKMAVQLIPNHFNFYKIYASCLINNGQLKQVDSLIAVKGHLLDKNSIAWIQRDKLKYLSKTAFESSNNYNDYIAVYLNGVNDYPENKGHWYYEIAKFYDEFYNDDDNYLKYSGLAWRNRINFQWPKYDRAAKYILIEQRVYAMLDNERYNETFDFINSDEAKEWFVGFPNDYMEWKNAMQFAYYIGINDYDRTKNFKWFDIPEGSVSLRLYLDTFRNNKYSIYKDIQNNLIQDNALFKVLNSCLLKDQEALFNHLDLLTSTEAIMVNGWLELDNYRIDPRFIAFRKKHYLQDVTVD